MQLLHLQRLIKSEKFIMRYQIEFDIFWWFWSHWCKNDKRNNCMYFAAVSNISANHKICNRLKESHLRPPTLRFPKEKNISIGRTDPRVLLSSNWMNKLYIRIYKLNPAYGQTALISRQTYAAPARPEGPARWER